MPNRNLLLTVVAATLLLVFAAGCTYPTPSGDLNWDYTPQQRDSMEFAHSHHYTENSNFRVSRDSIMLLPQSPADIMESMTDTVWLRKNDRIVVAGFARAATDGADSIWVKVARDQATMGWLCENEFLDSAIPDDPISVFIHMFSGKRATALLCVAAIAVGILLLKAIRRRKTRIVHFNDIDSPFPTLLCIDVAMMAVVYASVQHFVPQTWQEFYFHPTLNPFAVPPALGLLIAGFWAMTILVLASVDDMAHKLDWTEAVPYTVSLAGVMAVVYLLFVVTTRFYIGYPLFAAYTVLALTLYARRRMFRYVCGMCGHKLRHKGTCPFCGARNV